MTTSVAGGGGSYGSTVEEFPVGLRVLVVDDDVTCLKILERMLQRCRYRVTTCCQATLALSLLREKRCGFDVVISDVHMPDMDGFKLLELVGLEMDLPVIMMSADGGTNTVMRGIKHGACDYLIKPVRIEELKNIWQHVIRKKQNETKEYSGSMDDTHRNRRVSDDAEYASSVHDGADVSWRSNKKKRDTKEDENSGELDHEDSSSSKKPRVVWSVELHQQFVSAVSQLGIEKAVPKRILELMNVPGLTRENVASHLQHDGVQKFRLYLKRISGVAQHQNGFPNSLCGPIEPNTKVASMGRLDFQALSASCQIPSQTLAALHAELLGHPSSSLVLPSMNPPLLQASRQEPKCIPAEQEVAFGQPIFKCQSSISKQFSASIAGEHANLGGVNLNDTQKGYMMVPELQKQHANFVVSEPHHVINVQPSCMIAPSRSPTCLNVGQTSLPLNQSSITIPSQLSNSCQSGNSFVAIKSSSSFNNSNIALDYGLLSNSDPLCVAQTSDGDITNIRMLNGSPGSISSASSCSAPTNGDTFWRIPNSNANVSHATGVPVNLPNLCSQSSELKTGKPSEQGQLRNLGFVGKGTCIPSRFVVDEIESPASYQCVRNTCIGDDGARVKQELHSDFTDSSQIGTPSLPHFSSSNFMGVLSKDRLEGCTTKY